MPAVSGLQPFTAAPDSAAGDTRSSAGAAVGGPPFAQALATVLQSAGETANRAPATLVDQPAGLDTISDEHQDSASSDGAALAALALLVPASPLPPPEQTPAALASGRLLLVAGRPIASAPTDGMTWLADVPASAPQTSSLSNSADRPTVAAAATTADGTVVAIAPAPPPVVAADPVTAPVNRQPLRPIGQPAAPSPVPVASTPPASASPAAGTPPAAGAPPAVSGVPSPDNGPTSIGAVGDLLGRRPRPAAAPGRAQETEKVLLPAADRDTPYPTSALTQPQAALATGLATSPTDAADPNQLRVGAVPITIDASALAALWPKTAYSAGSRDRLTATGTAAEATGVPFFGHSDSPTVASVLAASQVLDASQAFAVSPTAGKLPGSAGGAAAGQPDIPFDLLPGPSATLQTGAGRTDFAGAGQADEHRAEPAPASAPPPADTALPLATPAPSAAVQSAAPIELRGAPGTPMLQQLAHAASFAAQRSNRTVRLVLHPEDLGSVDLRVTVGQTGVGVHFGVDGEATRQIVQASFGQLAQALDARGLQVDQLRVDLAGAQAWTDAQGSDGRGSYQQSRNSQTGRASATTGRAPADAETVRPIAATTRPTRGIDYRI
ncbi:MAG: flagellar hook-length control protein FliK [Chloroflexi bacterium]|nr:flagellar hook-length control protein FliK [Chloroflexota bacterium]